METANLDDLVNHLAGRLGTRPLLVVEYGSRIRGYGTFSSDIDIYVVYEDTENSLLRPRELVRENFTFQGSSYDVYYVTVQEFLRRCAAIDVHHMMVLFGKLVYTQTPAAESLFRQTRHAVVNIGAKQFHQRLISSSLGLLGVKETDKSYQKNHLQAVYQIALMENARLGRLEEGPTPIQVVYRSFPLLADYLTKAIHSMRRPLKEEEISELVSALQTMRAKVVNVADTNPVMPLAPYVVSKRVGDETLLTNVVSQLYKDFKGK